MRAISKYIIILLSLALGTIVFSCDKFRLDENSDTFFYVKVSQTELPVWVKGNTESNNLLIYINSGPGLTSIDAAHVDIYGWSDLLEENLAMVYYDQRGCGNAQGNIQEDKLTADQYVLDLDGIIDVLKFQYPDANVYMMGHGFGSFIGASYLLDTARQSKISGWISVNGAFNFDKELQWDYRRKFLLNIAEEELAKSNNTAYWLEARNWINSNPVINTDSQKEEWRNFLGQPGEGILPLEQAELSFRDYMSISFSSPYNPLPVYMSGNQKIVKTKLNEDTEGKNIISNVSVITIPGLFIWGRYDDLIPPEQGLDAFSNIDDSVRTEFKMFDNSSHQPFISNPLEFQRTIVDFINND